MKKTSKNKKGYPKIYTYEEYKKTFFPNTADEELLKEETPFRLGIKLAEKSLNKYRRLLSGFNCKN